MSIDELKEKILPVLAKFEVSRASLFGSIVRGEATESSDVDLLVELPARASLLDLSGLKIELEETLGKKVDVLTYKSLHPLLKDKILASQERIL